MITKSFKSGLSSLLFLFMLLHIFSCSNITGPIDFEGDYLLVIRNINYNWELGKLSTNGKQYVTIYRNPNPGLGEGVSYAHLSPDHSTIVINGGPNAHHGYYNIWLISAEGKLLYQVTYNGWRPRWSKDGQWIYYSKQIEPESGISDIYRYNIESKIEEPVIMSGYSEIQGEIHHLDYILSDISSVDSNEIIIVETDALLDANYYMVREVHKLVNYDCVNQYKDYYNISLDSLNTGFGSINPNDGKLYFTATDTSDYTRGYLFAFSKNNSELNAIFVPDDRERINSFAFSPEENTIAYLKQKSVILPDYRPDSEFYLVIRDLNQNAEEIILSSERDIMIMQWVVTDN